MLLEGVVRFASSTAGKYNLNTKLQVHSQANAAHATNVQLG